MNRVWIFAGFFGVFSMLAISAGAAVPSQADRDRKISFCKKPPVIKTGPLGLYSALYKDLRSLGGDATSTRILSKAFRRLWRMSRGAGKGNSRYRRFRKKVRKTLKKLQKKANEAYVFDHPARLMIYGMMRLQGRSMLRIEKQCLDHDTYKVFSFVPGSFRLLYPRNKPCKGTLYTELRRKIGFTELYYPVLTPFHRRTFMVSGQRVDLFAWRTATPALLDKVSKDDEFRWRLLKLRKKLKTHKNKASLLKKHKALIDREVAVMKKKMQDIKLVMGGYLLMYPHGGKPAYFGHLQFAQLKGVLQSLLGTTLGRYVLRKAVAANMRHIARK